jgi:hypothetical protein
MKHALLVNGIIEALIDDGVSNSHSSFTPEVRVTAIELISDLWLSFRFGLFPFTTVSHFFREPPRCHFVCFIYTNTTFPPDPNSFTISDFVDSKKDFANVILTALKKAARDKDVNIQVRNIVIENPLITLIQRIYHNLSFTIFSLLLSVLCSISSRASLSTTMPLLQISTRH